MNYFFKSVAFSLFALLNVSFVSADQRQNNKNSKEFSALCDDGRIVVQVNKEHSLATLNFTDERDYDNHEHWLPKNLTLKCDDDSSILKCQTTVSENQNSPEGHPLNMLDIKFVKSDMSAYLEATFYQIPHSDTEVERTACAIQ